MHSVSVAGPASPGGVTMSMCVCVLARLDSGIDLPVLSRKRVTGGEVDESQAEIWSGVCLTSLE